jgi:hypothetical protein
MQIYSGSRIDCKRKHTKRKLMHAHAKLRKIIFQYFAMCNDDPLKRVGCFFCTALFSGMHSSSPNNSFPSAVLIRGTDTHVADSTNEH